MLSRRDTLLGALALGACAPLPTQSSAWTPPPNDPRFAAIEQRIGGRVGVAALNTVTGDWIGRRIQERFAMCSTFKWLLAAHMLHYNPEDRSMNGTFGTNHKGEMIDEWDSHIVIGDETVETVSFRIALQKPNGTYFTHRYAAENNIPRNHIMHDVADYAAVSAWAGEKPVAVLCVDNVITQRPFSNTDLEALRLFAGYAGLAIENSRLNDALQVELQLQKQAEEQESRRRSMLEEVLELGKQVTETTDLKTTLQRIWHGVHNNLGFDRLGVFLYNEQRYSMDSMIGTDIHGNMEDTSRNWFPINEWSTFRVVLEKPDGLFLTHNYDVENNIPEGHEM